MGDNMSNTENKNYSRTEAIDLTYANVIYFNDSFIFDCKYSNGRTLPLVVAKNQYYEISKFLNNISFSDYYYRNKISSISIDSGIELLNMADYLIPSEIKVKLNNKIKIKAKFLDLNAKYNSNKGNNEIIDKFAVSKSKVSVSREDYIVTLDIPSGTEIRMSTCHYNILSLDGINCLFYPEYSSLIDILDMVKSKFKLDHKVKYIMK